MIMEAKENSKIRINSGLSKDPNKIIDPNKILVGDSNMGGTWQMKFAGYDPQTEKYFFKPLDSNWAKVGTVQLTIDEVREWYNNEVDNQGGKLGYGSSSFKNDKGEWFKPAVYYRRKRK